MLTADTLSLVTLGVIGLFIAFLLFALLVWVVPIITMGGLIGGFVGAVVAFLTSSSFLLTIPLAAIISALFFTLLLVRPDLVDVAPLWGAFFGGLGGLFLTSDPMFPALMAVAGACAGTSLPANLGPTEETDQRQ